MARRRDLTLSKIREALLARHGEPDDGAVDDPFALILREQVAQLASDERRRAALGRLEREVGLSPEAILRASPRRLEAVARSGGAIAASDRAARMKTSARLVREEWGGDLRRALRLSGDEAVRALARLPMIGRPGAEAILLLTRTRPVLALDSNALRVLLRLGYGEDEGRYEQTHDSVRAATATEEREDVDWMISLRALLRRHGRTTCRNTRPACAECPLATGCAAFSARPR